MILLQILNLFLWHLRILNVVKMVSKTITLIVRAVQTLFSTIIMALSGNMISTSGWNQIPRQGGNAAEVNYAMFISVFTLMSMLVFVPVAWMEHDNLEFFQRKIRQRDRRRIQMQPVAEVNHMAHVQFVFKDIYMKTGLRIFVNMTSGK